MMHPYHVMYLICEPFGGRNSLERLFIKLDAVDPLERQHLIGLTLSSIGGTYDTDLPTEEDVAEDLYSAFRERCYKLRNAEVEDFAVTYFVVSLMLNYMRLESDPAHAAASRDWLRGAAAHFADRAGDEELPQDSADKMIRMAEEAANNKEANRQMAAERYQAFCEDVLLELLPPKPPGADLLSS